MATPQTGDDGLREITMDETTPPGTSGGTTRRGGKNAASPKFWLIRAAGTKASEWDTWYKEGIATIDYPETGDLRQYKIRDALKQAVRGGNNDSLACWQFCSEMKRNDVIVVKKNRTHVIGHGEVTSDYSFDGSRPRHQHVRRVKWLSRTDEGGVQPREKLLVAKTLTDITRDQTQTEDCLRALKPFTHGGHPPEEDDQERPLHPLNLILYGPPGTGKTWHTVTRAVAIVEKRPVREVEQETQADRAAVKGRFDEHRRAGRIAMVTFHQNTTYEDFIEGIRPVLRDEANETAGAEQPDDAAAGSDATAGDVRYELSRGVFRQIAERAADDRDGRYVLVIDEINRGNVARIFGELITLIEDSKRIGRDDEAWVILPGSRKPFGVPANLHVVGTMNTADRSIALLDTALRRRFEFEERMPDPHHPGVGADVGGVDCRRLLEAMNRRIAVLLDREHQIGHTYFLRVDTREALAETFRNRIVPLLQEYFYDDWEKIRAVLNGNGFIVKSDPPEELVRSDLVDPGRSVHELLPAGDGRWTDPKEYRAIYETRARDEPPADDGEAPDD